MKRNNDGTTMASANDAMMKSMQADLDKAKRLAAPCIGTGLDPESGTILIAGRHPLSIDPVGVRMTIVQAIQFSMMLLNVLSQGVQEGEKLATEMAHSPKS